MNPAVLLIGGVVALTMLAPKQTRATQSARSTATQTNQTANRVVNELQSVANSIDKTGTAAGKIASATAAVVDTLDNALDQANAFLSEYGSPSTTAPVYVGTDLTLVSGQVKQAPLVKGDARSATNPTYYFDTPA